MQGAVPATAAELREMLGHALIGEGPDAFAGTGDAQMVTIYGRPTTDGWPKGPADDGLGLDMDETTVFMITDGHEVSVEASQMATKSPTPTNHSQL